MKQFYSSLDELSEKTDEELFQIYRGYPHQKPIEERYIAARILRSRSFDFKNSHIYLQSWQKEHYLENQTQGKIKFHYHPDQSDIITFVMFLALIFLSIVVIFPVFFPESSFTFTFTGDIWFFLNILSFVVFFYIFGFISHFAKTIKEYRDQKRSFEIFQQQLSA